MLVGVPREVKNHEHRVAITPAGVVELVRRGHRVLIEEGAGAGSSIPDGEFTASGIDALAYETVQPADGSLPLLAPMSEVAGRMAAQVGMRAEAVVLDTDVDRLRQLDFTYRGHLRTVASNSYEVEKVCRWADLVIGAVLVPGAKAPTLVGNELVSRMRSGSVLVDISIDQGGCFADSRPTTHDDPTYRVHGSVFYCVANMPGAVPRTSTWALTNVTLPYVTALADKGFRL